MTRGARPWLVALAEWRIWAHQARTDLRVRYARSFLGPAWTILTSLVIVIGMTAIWSTLFQQDPRQFAAYVFGGLMLWTFIGTSLTEGVGQFAAARSFLLNTNFPVQVVSLRVVARNLLVLLITMPLVICVAVVFNGSPDWRLLQLVPGLVLTVSIVLLLTYLIGLIGLVVTDLAQALPALLLLIMLMSPVYWPVDQVAERSWVYQYNPVYWVLTLVRGPILGEWVPAIIWAYSLLLLLVLIGLSIFASRKNYTRVKVLA